MLYGLWMRGIYLAVLEKMDLFYEQLRILLTKYDLDAELINDLLIWGRHIIKRPDKKPGTISIGYAFDEYFADPTFPDGVPLKKTPILHSISDDETFSGWEDFAREVVWYGRKENRLQHGI